MIISYNNPDKTLVEVGNVYDIFIEELSKLESLKNLPKDIYLSVDFKKKESDE
jgi:hypothetical protein